MKPPCKGCPDRTTGGRTTNCHMTCEKYKAYRAWADEQIHARVLLNDAKAATVEGFERVKRVKHNTLWKRANG